MGVGVGGGGGGELQKKKKVFPFCSPPLPVINDQSLESKYRTRQGTHCTGKTGKTGKMTKKIPVRKKTGNLEILPKHRENTGNLVCSSCKFPESQGIILQTNGINFSVNNTGY